MGRAQRYGNTFDWTTAVPNVALPDQLPGASRALSCENCRKRKSKFPNYCCHATRTLTLLPSVVSEVL